VINTEYNEVAAKYLFDDRHRNGNLFFSSGRPGGFGGPDIYESEITDSGFASPINIIELNTAAIETCFWVRGDGLEIIFSSNRPDLTGDMSKLDLWVSTRSSVYENWSTPESLGSIINTEGYLDVNPMLASADRTLYFASSRPNSHGPVGNMDIYISTRTRLR
jgi:WD40 repeat protein